MLEEILILCAIVMLPLIELRLAIPVGILSGTMPLPYGLTVSGLGLDPLLVFLIAVISNVILGFLVFNFLLLFDRKMRKTKASKYYLRILDRMQKKVHKKVEKYGVFGLAIFIGLPIPGSGVYFGSVGAYVLGFDRRKFYIANIIGVVMAGIIVTSLTMLGENLFLRFFF